MQPGLKHTKLDYNSFTTDNTNKHTIIATVIIYLEETSDPKSL